MTVEILDDEEVVVRTPEELKRMPRAYQKALISQIMINTEGELSGGDDYTMMFLPMAPNAEERQVCAERAAEEYDHYKIGKRVLAEIGIDTSYMEEQTIEERKLFSDKRLHQCTTWAERGIYSYIGEESALLMIREFAEGSYKPWADAVRTIILDEKIHIAHGARVCRNLAVTEEGREQLQAALDRLWPVFKDLFGTPDSERSKRAVRWGLRQTNNREALEKWLATVTPRIHALGLVVPS
ncbi:Phenylacetic acid catabolic protein [Micromonospora rosaria]|nr:Phenylacetic acid catabolic protein [Micromonospora rosaria]